MAKRTRIQPYKETHQQGIISIDKDIDVSSFYGDIGVLIASDGRLWICIDGESFIRFKPEITQFKEKRSNNLFNSQGQVLLPDDPEWNNNLRS